MAVPYHEAYAAPMRAAAAKLREAAALADDAGLRKYLELRAKALETDDYQPSDFAWLDMKTNTVDVVIGPDRDLHRPAVRLQGGRRVVRAAQGQGVERPARALRRAAPGAPARPARTGGVQAGAAGLGLGPQRLRRAVLRGRRERRLEDHRHQPAERRRSAAQEGHPPAPAQERDAGQVRPDSRADRGRAHRRAISRATSSSTPSSTTSCSTRWPTASASSGRSTARARCGRRSRTRRARWKRARPTSWASTWSPGCSSRASSTATLEDHYVTFLASILRSIRFGASEAHGRANAAQLSYFEEHGAFTRDSATGRYGVDFPKMRRRRGLARRAHSPLPGRRRLRRRQAIHDREEQALAHPAAGSGATGQQGHPRGRGVRPGHNRAGVWGASRWRAGSRPASRSSRRRSRAGGR